MDKITSKIAFLPEITSGPEAVRSIKKFIDEVASKISDTMGDLTKVAFSDKDLIRISNKMRKLRNEFIAARAGGNKEQEESLRKQFNEEQQNLENVIKRRKEGMAILQKDQKKFLEKPAAQVAKFGETMGETLSDVLSGQVESVGRVFNRFGGMTKKWGYAMQAREKEVGGGANKAIGAFLRKLGPTLLAVGAIAAAFTAIVKTLIDADTKMRELSKTLIDGGAAAGDIVEGAAGLEGHLRTFAKFAESQPFNEMWGTMPEDLARITGAFSEAGFTLKEMRTQLKGAGGAMGSYRQATAAALTYSKLLGETAEKVATDMGDRMDEFGVSLQGVREDFANIYEVAQLSGFGTKRFFNMVLQATSGMSMYNVRIEEAAGLMMNLSKILGKKTGEDFFNSIKEGLSGMSSADLLKRVKILGQGAVSDLISRQIGATSTAFAEKTAGFFGKDLKKGAEVMSALGIDMGMSQDLLRTIARGGPAARKAQEQLGDRIARQLEGMGPEQIMRAIAEMRKAGAPDELLRQMENMVELTRGVNGSLSDQANALAALGPGGQMAAQIGAMESIINKPLYMAMDKDRQILENVLGVDRKALMQFERVSRERAGSFSEMQQSLNEANAQGKTISKSQNKQFAEVFKMAVKDGKIYHAVVKEGNVIFGTEIRDVRDAIMGQGSALKNIPKKLVKQEKTAKEMARQTLTVQRKIEQYLREVLGDIRDSVRDIKAAVTGDLNTEEAKTKQQQVDVLKSMKDQMEAAKKAAKTKEEQEKLDRSIRATGLIQKTLTKKGSVRGGLIWEKEGEEFLKTVEDNLLKALRRPRAIMSPKALAAGVAPEAPPVRAEQFAFMQNIAEQMFGKEKLAEITTAAKAEAEKAKEEERKKRAETGTRMRSDLEESFLRKKYENVAQQRIAEQLFDMFQEGDVRKYVEQASKVAVALSKEYERQEKMGDLLTEEEKAKAIQQIVNNYYFQLNGDAQGNYKATKDALATSGA